MSLTMITFIFVHGAKTLFNTVTVLQLSIGVRQLA